MPIGRFLRGRIPTGNLAKNKAGLGKMTGWANFGTNRRTTGTLARIRNKIIDEIINWYQKGQDIYGDSAEDYFGNSVSLSSDGTIVAIGARGNDDNGSYSGLVRVFQWNGTDWVQIGDDINGDSAEDALGTSVSLSSDGTILAVGAQIAHLANSPVVPGYVRVYEWTGTDWVQKGNDIDGENAGDRFGGSVSLSSNGTILAVGARKNSENGAESGHVRVYEWNGTIWDQIGPDIDGENADDLSGTSVSLSGDGTILAVGAPKNDDNGGNSGHVRVYQWDGTIWDQIGNDIDGDAAGDQLGYSVSLSSDGTLGGTILAVGAPYYNDGPDTNSGQVRVYEWTGTDWVQKGNDIDGENEDDLFGFSVSLSSDGTILAVGAPFNGDKGHVRVFQWDGTIWDKIGNDIDGENASDELGHSVSLSSDGTLGGTILAVGSFRGKNAIGYKTGNVRVHEWHQ